MDARDWRTLVEDVLLALNGLAFTKEEFIKRCSDTAWERFNGWNGSRLRTPEELEEVKGNSKWRYPYIGEKVTPWLLLPSDVRAVSRLHDMGVFDRRYPAHYPGLMGRIPPLGRWEVSRSKNSVESPVRVLRVTAPEPETAHSRLQMKAAVCPGTVPPDLLSLVVGNWRLVGDYLQDGDLDQPLGERLAVDEEAGLLYALAVVHAGDGVRSFPSVWDQFVTQF